MSSEIMRSFSGLKRWLGLLFEPRRTSWKGRKQYLVVLGAIVFGGFLFGRFLSYFPLSFESTLAITQTVAKIIGLLMLGFGSLAVVTYFLVDVRQATHYLIGYFGFLFAGLYIVLRSHFEIKLEHLFWFSMALFGLSFLMQHLQRRSGEVAALNEEMGDWETAKKPSAWDSWWAEEKERWKNLLRRKRK